jgi:hypothetical protein
MGTCRLAQVKERKKTLAKVKDGCKTLLAQLEEGKKTG